MLVPILLASALPALPQHPPVRPTETVDIAGGSGYGQLAVASSGEFSGVMWLSDHNSGGRYGVYVSPAGGRGVGFGAPVRVDADPNDAVASLREDSLQASGDGVYALWIDHRDQDPGAYGTETDLWLARSHDAGASWMPEQRLEKGVPQGVGYALDFAFAVDGKRTAAAADDTLHLAVIAGDPGAQTQGMSYLRSTDGGATWSTPLTLAASATQELRMSVNGPHVHLAWMEWRGLVPEIFYQRSDDGGASWLPQAMAMTPNSNLVMTGALALDSDGPLAALAWTERVSSHSYAPALYARISHDGGRRWGPPSRVGNYPLGSVVVRDPDLHVQRDTVALAWADNRAQPGVDYLQTFVAATRDHGATWFESALSAGEGRAPRFARGGRDAGHVVIAYTTDQIQGEAECATSRDRGLHWSAGFPVSSRPDRVLECRVAWNDRYDNAVVAWLGSNSIQRIRSFAGGFRPQRVSVHGWPQPGGIIWFEIDGFPARDEGAEIGVLVSGAEGAWRPPGGRDTGLSYDSVLSASLGMIPGALSGAVQHGGVGQTSAMTVPLTMPTGKSLFFTAFAFRQPNRVGAVTDVVSTVLN